MDSSHLSKGKRAEQLACNHLLQQGLVLIEKNYHCRQGEIDLIMTQNDSLIFIEVRYRKNNDYGGAKESITRAKQKKIHITALHYMQRHNKNVNARFDVIAITGEGKQQQLEWIQNAF
ncbi:MAG: YraN family protein [Gammaproteobacteria bacterium]|nr:YraN family protein [Gammaproteobacteria bacterium]